MARTPLLPKHPERICWGCDKYCAADSLARGNGTIRTPHPVELFGEDWLEWSARQADEDAETVDEVPLQPAQSWAASASLR